MQTAFQQFTAAIQERLDKGTFVKITLANYKGADELKNIYIKKLIIKAKPVLSFTYRYQRRDIVKNYEIAEGIDLIKDYFGPNQFRNATLFSLEFDEELILKANAEASFKQRSPSQKELAPLTHDKQKLRNITDLEKPYLHALQITDEQGKVYKNAQDKYKQINHYIEILSSMLKELSDKETIHIADMGSGKGYLTFALYDYLTNVLHKKTDITGVEFRQDMVDLCNKIAKQSSFDQLHFEKGAIADFEPKALDVIIALHACDTATDDAIARGINHQAEMIVVAPCCHKQIRKAMTQGKPNTDMDFLLKYGLFFERQAEMLTDSIRLLILEYFGYQTKVVDFVSDQHTPKNVMLIAKKKHNVSKANEKEFKLKLASIKEFWGIDVHYLEQILAL